ncbi:MAG: DUF3209 family protein [Halolamina sp.]
MSCHELEALRIGLMNVLGTADRSARRHAEQELAGHLDGPIAAMVEADDLSELARHFDAALVDLEETVATTPEDDPSYDYRRGRLVACRDAETALSRLLDHGDGLLDDLGSTHDVLHEAFPADDG